MRLIVVVAKTCEANHMTKAVALNTFRISETDWEGDQAIKGAYDTYSSKLFDFGQAMRELKQATKELHDLLDVPLREAGLIPDGKDWTLKDDEDGMGVYIQVWAEPRQRGRRKSDVPTKQLSFRSKAKGHSKLNITMAETS
jgi:hypothetical protein